MEIVGHRYAVNYDTDTGTVNCTGRFRLIKSEYEPISDLLREVVHREHNAVTLDLTELEYLNSSGIKTVYEFVIDLRNRESSQLKIEGNTTYKWQQSIFDNCRRLMPDLEVVMH